MPLSLAKATRADIYADQNLLVKAVNDNRAGFMDRMAGDFPKALMQSGLPNGRVGGYAVTHFLLADGTWNNPQSQTNIHHAFNCAAQNLNTQLNAYFIGVGADLKGTERLVAGAFGIGLRRNIMAMYLHLVENYQDGDEIALAGYSRGAYTVRALAGMINKAGILDKRKIPGWETMSYEEKFRYIEVVFDFYKNKDIRPGDDRAKAFRKNFSHADSEGRVTTKIKAMGLFDTVGALGIPDANMLLRTMKLFTRGLYDFYDVNISPIVQNCFHAGAIDEMRKTFPFTPAMPSQSHSAGQTIRHALFRGEHYIGGGTPERKGLADTAALWVINNLKTCGVKFNEASLAEKFKPDVMVGVPVAVEGKNDPLGFLGKKLRDFSAIPFGKFVHQSVLNCMRQDSNYRPKNIEGISTLQM